MAALWGWGHTPDLEEGSQRPLCLGELDVHLTFNSMLCLQDLSFASFQTSLAFSQPWEAAPYEPHQWLLCPWLLLRFGQWGPQQ